MVLLHINSEQSFALDQVGTGTVRHHEVDAETLRADVDSLTHELLKEGLLEQVEPSTWS